MWPPPGLSLLPPVSSQLLPGNLQPLTSITFIQSVESTSPLSLSQICPSSHRLSPRWQAFHPNRIHFHATPGVVHRLWYNSTLHLLWHTSSLINLHPPSSILSPTPSLPTPTILTSSPCCRQRYARINQHIYLINKVIVSQQESLPHPFSFTGPAVPPSFPPSRWSEARGDASTRHLSPGHTGGGLAGALRGGGQSQRRTDIQTLQSYSVW